MSIAIQWYRHKLWAHDRFAEVIATLTPELFIRDNWSSFPSIRDTMLHVFSSDGRWLDRWQGRVPRAKLEPVDFPYLEDLRGKWREIEEAQLKFVEGLGDNAVGGSLTLPAEDDHPAHTVPTWQPLYHVAHHAGYHRGQLATMLRQLGHRPPTTDFIDFVS
jgi:uncharacterized damage-inducible protein DinB